MIKAIVKRIHDRFFPTFDRTYIKADDLPDWLKRCFPNGCYVDMRNDKPTGFFAWSRVPRQAKK